MPERLRCPTTTAPILVEVEQLLEPLEHNNGGDQRAPHPRARSAPRRRPERPRDHDLPHLEALEPPGGTCPALEPLELVSRRSQTSPAGVGSAEPSGYAEVEIGRGIAHESLLLGQRSSPMVHRGQPPWCARCPRCLPRRSRIPSLRLPSAVPCQVRSKADLCFRPKVSDSGLSINRSVRRPDAGEHGIYNHGAGCQLTRTPPSYPPRQWRAHPAELQRTGLRRLRNRQRANSALQRRRLGQPSE